MPEISALRSGLVATLANSRFHSRHVEGGVLSTHEPGGADPVLLFQRQRQQQERLTVRIAGDDDKGDEPFALANISLP